MERIGDVNNGAGSPAVFWELIAFAAAPADEQIEELVGCAEFLLNIGTGSILEPIRVADGHHGALMLFGFNVVGFQFSADVPRGLLAHNVFVDGGVFCLNGDGFVPFFRHENVRFGLATQERTLLCFDFPSVAHSS